MVTPPVVSPVPAASLPDVTATQNLGSRRNSLDDEVIEVLLVF
jgi:hypothetical protein